jgi:flagellar hook-associated protein 1 FlgK
MDDSALSGGTLGGTLQYRSETLDSAQNSIGRLAASLAQSYNNQNKLGMDLNGNVGTNLFSIGSPLVLSNAKNDPTTTGSVTATIADANSLSTSDYELRFDGTNYNLVRLSDSKTVATAAAPAFPTPPALPTPVTLTADGLSVTASGDLMRAGDSFQIQPTRQIADQFDSIVTDPAKVAGAAPVKTTAATTNTGTGTAKFGSAAQGFSMAGMPITATYDTTTSTYTFQDSGGVAVTPTSGPTPNGTANDYVINGVTVSFGGTPAAGDQFTIGSNAGAVSDNSNVLAMAKLQTTKLIGGVSTFSDGYAILVNDVGSKAKSIDIAQTSQESITTQVQTQQQSVSGVNLDEETVSMLRFQQLYQASSQVIKTASSLFDTLLSIA